MTGNAEVVPHALTHNLRHNKVIHERVVVMTVATDDVPGISFDPRPPQAGDSAADIVAGFLEAMKAGQLSQQALNNAVPINVLQRLEGPSNEAVIGKIHAAATGSAHDEVVKSRTSIWGLTQKQEARYAYTYHNCVLIR